MDEIRILDNLYMFSTINDQIDFTFNQYLLLGEEPLLVHTGSSEQTVVLVPKIKKLLGDRALAYVFVSHFEGDECGGLNILLEQFPKVKTICSQVTARQLNGFGYTDELLIKKPGEILKTKDYSLTFLAYPSEMHLWEGLIALESRLGLLFSSDLFIRMGMLRDAIVSTNWEDEVKAIAPHQIPSLIAYESMQKSLFNLPVNYIAPGHGPVLKV